MSPLIFHKTLPLLLSPVVVTVLLLIAALIWKRRVLIAAALFVLVAFGTPHFANTLLRSLEDQYPRRSINELPEADAAVVLGGVVTTRDPRDPSISEWTDAVDRFERGVELVEAHKVAFVVFSATHPADAAWPETHGRYQKVSALHRGIPDSAILLTPMVRNTAEEAEATRQFAREHNWKRILLVTSAFHMPRAMLLFRNAPFEVVPVPVDYQTVTRNAPQGEFSLDRYLPQTDALNRSERAIREYLGLAFYRLTNRN